MYVCVCGWCNKEHENKLGKVCGKLNIEGENWWLVTSLFADNCVLMADSEKSYRR